MNNQIMSDRTHILNIIIPVLNEEKRLEKGIRETIAFVRSAKIPHILSIVDNGSIDSTPILAQKLCESINKEESPVFSYVEYMRLEEKGVGLALRSAISHNAQRKESCAFIGYMDLDLSTDLRHLCEVYARLCGGAKIVVGSRLLKDSQVIGRSFKREILSRGFNMLLKILLRVNFSDAMCGFKFYQAHIAQELKTLCNDDKSWFYCAQMLIMAQAQGIPIEEIAVRWEDDPVDSKVKVFALSRTYLKQIWCIYKTLYKKGVR